MHFAPTSPPIAGRVGDSTETATQLRFLGGFHRALPPEGRAFAGVFNLHFRLNPFLNHNHHVHTRTSSFYPSIGSPDLLPSFPPRSSVLFSRRSFAFPLFGSSTQTYPHGTRVGAFPRHWEGARVTHLGTSLLGRFFPFFGLILATSPSPKASKSKVYP